MDTQKQSRRLLSLDALRGFDMFFIMGGASLFVALATLCPTPFFQAIAEQMHHVEWNGLTHHDTIFPLFLFIAGISFPFSLAKQRERGKTEGEIYRKIVRRGLTLVLLGFVYNGLLHFDFEHQRYASVLGRIGLAWMFGALLFVRTRVLTRVWITAAILVGYWLLLAFIGCCWPLYRLRMRRERACLRWKVRSSAMSTACCCPVTCIRRFTTRREFYRHCLPSRRLYWECSRASLSSGNARG